MSDHRRFPLAALLAFIAATLAAVAVGIGYARRGSVDWSMIAAALFMAALGWGALQRSKSDGV